VLPEFQRFDDLPTPAITRRNLPHWRSAGATYFVTFRAADSLPTGIAREIEVRLQGWLRCHGLKSREELPSLSPAKQAEFQRLLNRQEQRAIDAGHGACPFREPKCREILASVLHRMDGVLYLLDDYVLMPNHAHVLVLPTAEATLSSIVAAWKKHSARRVNEARGEQGKLWQAESFDHIVRGTQQLQQYRRYISENPTNAGLQQTEFTLGRGTGVRCPDPGAGD
jgi:type I restriction enzyme R subunit